MISKYFTKSEADKKVGTKIRTLREFSGVPQYTTGKVTGTYEVTEGCGLDITWDIAHTFKPLTDGFSKDEYDQFLQEL